MFCFMAFKNLILRRDHRDLSEGVRGAKSLGTSALDPGGI